MAGPAFSEAFRFWLKLGFINFGGPTGQIALMHKELVEKRGWISEDRFLHALNYCMLLPGPEAMQLAVYVGWLLHGTLGGIVAGLFFFLPSVVALWALSWTYAAYGSVPVVAGLFFGLKAVVLAIVAHAALRIGRRALMSPLLVALAAGAFVALLLAAPFPLVVLGALLVGFVGSRVAPGQFPRQDASPERAARPDPRRLALVAGVGALLWLVPLAVLFLVPGPSGVWRDAGLFFSGAALVTFGGAYAVLAYIGQAAVAKGWLAAGQMVDGLGLAETTPGPLIMVVAFVGFMAGWTLHGSLAPWLSGTVGLLAAVYFTFLPSFLFILLGAPYVEVLRGRPALSAALSAVTAAVVGVILSLAVFFAQHVFLPAGVDWAAVTLALGAFLVLTFTKAEPILVILAGAFLGLLWRLLA